MEAVLAIEQKQEDKGSNLEDKDSPSILTLFMQWDEIIVSNKNVLLFCYANCLLIKNQSLILDDMTCFSWKWDWDI